MNILFFSSEVIEENGNGQLRVHKGMDQLPEWMAAPPHVLERKVYVCIETQAKLPFGRKSQNSFLCPLFPRWGWIKFLESPYEEGRQGPSEFLMAPLSEGMPFFQLLGLDLRALNISLFFVFPHPCPLPSLSLWKAEVRLFLIARLKQSWVLCFWTWPNDFSLRDHVYQKFFCFFFPPLKILTACSRNPAYLHHHWTPMNRMFEWRRW